MVPYIEAAFILSRVSADGRKRAITAKPREALPSPGQGGRWIGVLRLGRARPCGIKAVEFPMLRAWIRLFW